MANLTHLRTTLIPRLIAQFQLAYKVDLASEVTMLHDVTEQLDKILFDDYIKRKSAMVAVIIRKGVLGGTVDWFMANKPTGSHFVSLRRPDISVSPTYMSPPAPEVHPFIYDALLSLVLVHAEVSAIAQPLVARVLCSLVEELAKESLDAFSKVERFGMGGMLQVRF